MIKLRDILNESPQSEYPPYMYSPVGFGCHVCKYHYIEEGKHMCSNKYYQEYILEQFPNLENTAELVDDKGEPIKDPSKYCSNWFMPKGESEAIDEDLKSNIKKGLVGAALATSMMGSPAAGSEKPIKSKGEPTELSTYGVAKSTNEIISRIKTILDIDKPITKLTKEDLKSAYARINMDELKTDIESNFRANDISNLQAELDWVLGGDMKIDYTGVIDKQTIDAVFKYIGRVMDKKPRVGNIPDEKSKSYPFGHYKR